MMNETQKKKNIFSILKDRIYILSIIIVSLGYIFYGLFSFDKTGKSVVEIFGACGVALLIGTTITSFLRKEGLHKGRNDELYKASLLQLAEKKQETSKHSDKLPLFCMYKTEQETNTIKRDIITNANLKYKYWLCGFYDKKENYDKLEEYQQKALKEAKKVKIKPYQCGELLSDLPNSKSRINNRFGDDTKDYERSKFISSLFSKVAISIVSGLYTLGPLQEGNIGQSFWNAIQISLWLLLGNIDYNNAKDFILNEYRQTHIIQKTELLNEFLTIINNCPHKLDKYDDEQIFNEYLKEQELLNNNNNNEEEIEIKEE